jgi:hypothetical protein
MGFFDDFFGKSQKRDIETARKRAIPFLEQGKKEAEAHLKSGIDNALLRLQGGYGDATGRIEAGADRARGEVTDAYGNAETAITDALGRTRGTLQPWIASGRNAQDRYDTALGLNGQDAANQFYNDFASTDNPMRAYRDELANKQLQQQFNARGQSNSGRFGTAVSRASLERGEQDQQTYLSRLEQQGARGGQYATTLAGHEARGGENIANLRTGKGDRLADITLGSSNKLGDLAYGYGRDTSAIEAGKGEQLANLAWGYGNTRAGNEINYGNALAGTRGIGTNNLLNLIGNISKAAGSYFGMKG